MAYQGLSRAVLNFDYLHTNSTTHEFLFGALAELLDNSRDAQATKIDVFTLDDDNIRGGYMLCFLDDGHGMDEKESTNVFQFGKSYKRSDDSNLIGQYGNGLKSGSMRIGNDFIMFTKRNGIMTCLFLSRTFHTEENIDEVIVPMPSFNAHTGQPLARTAADKTKHRIEMSLILKYSPFKTEENFFEQFKKIIDHGTLVIVYNMKLMDNGQPELDIRTDVTDILLAGTTSHPGESDDSFVPERKSFREYTSILYANPKMKVYIQGNKVRTKKLGALLYKPKVYKYSSNKFKARSEHEAKLATEAAKGADARAREAESKARDLENKYGQGGSKEARSNLRQSQTQALELRNEAKTLTAIAEQKEKACKEPKTLNFVFGINIGNRKMDGCFMYNCSRLIKMYEKVGPQLEGGVQCSGIVGYVDIPYTVLEPTHNKQDFADNREYTILKKALGEYMLDYWKNCSGVPSQGVLKFWEGFGYISNNWKDPPSDEPKFLRKRMMNLPIMIQCDLCLKWRKLPFSASSVGQDFPEHWDCEINPDSSHNRCSQAEEKLNIAVALFKKEIKSAEQKLELQQEKARKEYEKFKAMKKTQPVITRKEPPVAQVTSSRQVSFASRQSVLSSRQAESSSRQAIVSSRQDESYGRRNSSERASNRRDSNPERTSSRRDSYSDRRRERKPSPPPPPPPPSKPIGKAKPVISYKQKTPTRPVGKAAPVVQSKPTSNNKAAFISRNNSRSSIASSRSAAQVSRRSSSSSSTSSKKGTKRKGDSSTEEDSSSESESEKTEVKKRRTTTNNKETSQKVVETDGSTEPESIEAISSPFSSDMETDSEALGQQVEARISGTWHTGKVFKVQRKGRCERWRIKFDKNAKDKYDKWFDSDSKDLRVVTSDTEEDESDNTVSNNKNRTSRTMAKSKQSEKNAALKEPVTKAKPISRTAPSSRIKPQEKEKDVEEEEEELDEQEEEMDETPPEEKSKAKNNQSVAKETHTVKEKEKVVAKQKNKEIVAEKDKECIKKDEKTKTDETVLENNNESAAASEIHVKLGNGYRKCLRYFLPPSWSMNKEQVNHLSLEELSNFTLDSFFDHYERGLRDLVGGFQVQAQEKQAESDETKKKLTRLRKMIAQLLKSINDDINISEDCEGEEIDDLLAECVRQAQQEDSST